MLILTCLFAFCDNIKLQWCPNTDPAVTGYIVYYGSGPTPPGWTAAVYSADPTNCIPPITPGTNYFRQYTNVIPVGTNLNTVVSNLVKGETYFFAVTAVDAFGAESDFSDETKFTVPATNPTNLPPSQPQSFKFYIK